MAPSVLVQWIHPKHWEGYREKIVRSTIRGKIEEVKEARALWWGKLYRVLILDQNGKFSVPFFSLSEGYIELTHNTAGLLGQTT